MTLTSFTLMTMALTGKLPGSLKDCEIHGPAFGLDRIIRCPARFTVDIFTTFPSAKEAEVLSNHGRLMTSSGDPREMMLDAEVIIAGKKRKGFQYSRRNRKGTLDIFLLTTVPAGKGSSRLVRCSAAMEQGCVDAFNLVAKGLPEVTMVPKSPTPTFAGRSLELGAGCTFKAGGQLTCGPNELTWLALYPGGPETLDTAETGLRTMLGVLGDLSSRDRYCKVEGSDVLCREVTATGKGGAKVHVLYGFAMVRDVSLYVGCTTSADLSTELPPPCAQVMGLKPEAK